MNASGPFSCLFLALATAPAASPSRAAGASVPADVAAVVESVFAPGAGQDLPGAAVVVLRDGSVVHAKAYGLASVELGVPNTTATRFRLASVTKSFTALALLRLAEQGRVSLDDPLEKHVPGFVGGDRILLRHVLSHTAGLPDFVSLEEARKMPPDGAPGERLNYSNVGYSLLGRVIEKVTGQTYEDHLRESIFLPLGMAGSGVDRRAPVTKGRACGYLFLPEGGIVNAEHTDTADAPGAGGLSSTAEDMGRWASALLAGRIVSKETLERATTPVTLPGGRLGAYGQGFMTVPFRGLREFGHGGDISGFNSYVAFYPDERLAVIVLSNVGMRPPGPVPTAGDVAHRIVAGLVGGRLGPEWPPVVALSPETLARYAGRYRIVAPPPVQAVMGETIDFTVEGGRLFASAKQGRVEVFAESETSFFGKDSPARITFLPGEASMEGVLSLLGLREYRLKREP